MAKRPLTALFLVAALAAAIVILHHPKPVRAQSTQRLPIASISVSADQTLTYPLAPALPNLQGFPDEHTTFFPPATTGAPYLIFGSGVMVGSSGSQPMGALQ